MKCIIEINDEIKKWQDENYMKMADFAINHANDLPTVSKMFNTVGDYEATNYLIKGNIEGYKKFSKFFNSLKIPDYRPSIIDGMFSGNKSNNPPMIIHNYLDNFKGDAFSRQYELMEYVKKQFSNYSEEFNTGFGKCDLFIRGKETFLLELKPGKIITKDIYQCHEYHRYKDGLHPIIILGHKIDPVALKRADEYGIAVYLYKISQIAPTKINITHIQGEPSKMLDKLKCKFQFIGEFDSIARDLGWKSS